MMILVTGGSGSGKSAFAEDCVVSFGKPDPENVLIIFFWKNRQDLYSNHVSF